MKISFVTLLISVLLSSCLQESKKKILPEKIDKKIDKKNNDLNLENTCPIDSLAMLDSEYNGTNFYTENSVRGKGVITIFIDQKVEFLNLDTTLFGSISLMENKKTYKINLPKNVIAREILPNEELQVFSFDAEFPESSNDFITVYINLKKRLIKKQNLKFKFRIWEDYIKSSFIILTPNTSNVTKEEKTYWYKVLEIKKDSMKIKSVNRPSCDYIEDYKDVTKWIKWKNDSCKTVDFDFCY